MTCIFQIFWFLLDRFGLPKIEKVFKSGWFKSFQVYNSSFLAWWFSFLLNRFWLPKTDKVIKSGWFQSFQFYRSDLLVWWLWFLLDTFGLPKFEKVFKSGWLQSFQFNNSDLLAWWLWSLLDRFGLPKLEKVFKSGCWCVRFSFLLEGLRLKGCERYRIRTGSRDVKSDPLVWWFWFLLDTFGLPKFEKVFKSGWLQSFQLNNSDLLVCWLWFLLDRFGLPKLEKVFQSGCWCVRFSFLLEGLRLKGCGRYRIRTGSRDVKSDPLFWWFWFLLDTFGLPKLQKVFKSGWLQSFQLNNSDLLVWWLWFLLAAKPVDQKCRIEMIWISQIWILFQTLAAKTCPKGIKVTKPVDQNCRIEMIWISQI